MAAFLAEPGIRWQIGLRRSSRVPLMPPYRPQAPTRSGDRSQDVARPGTSERRELRRQLFENPNQILLRNWKGQWSNRAKSATPPAHIRGRLDEIARAASPSSSEFSSSVVPKKRYAGDFASNQAGVRPNPSRLFEPSMPMKLIFFLANALNRKAAAINAWRCCGVSP